MNDLLQQEITPPVRVTLGGKEYPLEFSMGAVLLYKKRTGDNLCQIDTWHRVAPIEDPERFLACLWAGLHRYDPASKSFLEQLGYDELSHLVDFSNTRELTVTLTTALLAQFPKAKDPDPNAPAPETRPAEASSGPESPNSGPSPASTSV